MFTKFFFISLYVFYHLTPNDSFGKDLSIDENVGCNSTRQDHPQLTVLERSVRQISDKTPCGLSGSVDERIKDCSQQRYGFVLVTRTKDGKEVHKEVATGLLWSDRLPSSMSHYNAEKACKATLPEVAGISGVTWRLPSKEEYEQAEKNGIRRMEPPYKNYWYWTSSRRPGYSGNAYLFGGGDDDPGNGCNCRFDNYIYRSITNIDRGGSFSVRCVAR